MHKIYRYIKNEKVIILTILALLLIGLLCWIGSKNTEAFGLNFFTEILGVTVTVFVIDRLIQSREERKNIPQKIAAYEDVRLYTSRYIHFWTQAYRESVPEEDPETIQDFFSERGMTKIFSHLYMDSEPNVIPIRKWWDWIFTNAKEFKNNGDKILDRHSHNLDPVAFGLIHQLTESRFNEMILSIPTTRQIDILENYPRVEVLGNYTMKPQQDDFHAILGLVKWCNEQYVNLKPNNDSIKNVSEYSRNIGKTMPPKCMIPPNILRQQIDRNIAFRNN